MSSNSPFDPAFNPEAPHDERMDAMRQLQAYHAPKSVSDLIKANELTPVIDWIKNDLEESEMNKSLSHQNVIPFPSDRVRDRKEGMQSVWLDDFQIHINGDFYDKPGIFTFQSMRNMVDQTPILNAVIMTRIRQVQRFCHTGPHDKPGYSIRMKDDDAHPNKDEQKSIALLEGFFANCGWEKNPRQRQRLHRDSFPSFMSKLVRDTLTMDSMPIETEYKRDKSLGIDGLYAVDGGSIRLCTEDGYMGEDEIYALQVIQGRIRSVYTYEDLIYVPRNPRTDVLVGGYGLSEPELLVRVVTGFLNAFNYNTKYFDSNSIPKGLLHLCGNYSEQDMAAFKRYWNAMVKGVSNAWTLPVMISKDQESKAAFEKFGVDVEEMLFSKWMTFLTSIICAIFGIAPDEINFESFTAGRSALSGNDTEEKLANSKDKGLDPLLTYYSDLFTDYIVQEFGEKYRFAFNGLEDVDPKQRWEESKMISTVNEIRAERGDEKITEPWGDAPLNPVLVPIWQAEQQATNGDFGQPGEAPPPGEPEPGQGEDFGTPPPPGDAGGDGGAEPPADESAAPAGGQPPMAKSFGLPVYSALDF